MSEIVITRKNGDIFTILLDPEDYEWAKEYKWHMQGMPPHWLYAARSFKEGGKLKGIFMHREILERQGYANFKVCDHIDRNPLNNRRNNLRPADYKMNANNREWTVTPGRKRTLEEPEPVKCKICRKEFIPRRKTANIIKATYCSRECQRKGIFDHSSESQSKKAKKKRKGKEREMTS